MPVTAAKPEESHTDVLAPEHREVVECLRSEAVLLAAQEEAADPRSRPIDLLLYTGAVVERFWGNFIIELTGIRAPERLGLMLEHGFDWKAEDCKLGIIENIRLEAGRGLAGTGRWLQGDDFPDARKAAASMAQGYPWQSSIRVEPVEIVLLAAGETRVVNGLTVVGPIEIWTESELVSEASLVIQGADSKTTAALLRKKQETRMGLLGKNKKNDKPGEKLKLAGKETEGETQALGEIDDMDDAELQAYLEEHRPDLMKKLAEKNADDEDDDETNAAATDDDEELAAPATIAQLKALKGADDAFVVACMSAEPPLTIGQAKAMLSMSSARSKQAKLEAEGAAAPAGKVKPNAGQAGAQEELSDAEKLWKERADVRLCFDGHENAWKRFHADQLKSNRNPLVELGLTG